MASLFEIDDNLKTALITGALASAFSALVFGETGSINVSYINTNIPSYLMIGASTAVSSVVGDWLVSEMCKKMTSVNQLKYNELLALKYGMTGLTTALSMKTLINGFPNENLLKAGLMGAGSKAGAEWLDKQMTQNTMASRLSLF